MLLACVGDLHLVSERDPHGELRRSRAFFAAGYPSLRRLLDLLNARRPDLVVFLGDLVDWLSEENVVFALDVLSRLRVPWLAVPGNHDLAMPTAGPADRRHAALWRRHGVDFADRLLDAGDFGLVLLDNSLSDVTPASAAWLADGLARQPRNLVCQHVPLDIPGIRAHVAAAAPGRDLAKYTCSGSPGLWATHYRGRVQAVCNGHVHLDGTVRSDGCVHHLCSLALTMTDPGRGEATVAAATLLRCVDGSFQAEQLVAAV